MSARYPWETAHDLERELYERGRLLRDRIGELDPTNPFELDLLCEQLSLEEQKAYIFAHEYDAKLRSQRHAVASAPTPRSPSKTDDEGSDGDLWEILADYSAMREKKVSPGTVQGDAARIRLFLRFLDHKVGKRVRAGHLTLKLVRDYCSFLDKVGFKVSTAHPLSAEDLKPSSRGISGKSKFAHAGAVAAFLSWLPDQGYRADRQFAHVVRSTFPKPRKKKEQLSSFTREEMQTIFGADEYRQGTFKLATDFWAPLLSAFSGARQAEICQLRCDDVRYEDALWLLAITDKGEGQELKTPSAERELPIHDTLVRLGFLKFVEWRRSRGEARLFPEEERTPKGYFGAYSKRFNRFRGAVGIATDRSGLKRDFHSFRHAFNAALKRANVPTYHVKYLMGHSQQVDGESFGTYGKEIYQKGLAEHVAGIDHGIDITAIKPNGFRGYDRED